MWKVVIAACLATCPGLVSAAEVQVTASNGVVVKKTTDDFSAGTGFHSPAANKSGVAFYVNKRIETGKKHPYLEVMGIIDYSSGVNLDYHAATLKGGADATIDFYNREVGSCSRSPLRRCSYSDYFQISLTPAQLKPFLSNETLDIKFIGRHSAADNPVIQVPMTYVKAVLEVATPPAKPAKKK